MYPSIYLCIIYYIRTHIHTHTHTHTYYPLSPSSWLRDRRIKWCKRPCACIDLNWVSRRVQSHFISLYDYVIKTVSLSWCTMLVHMCVRNFYIHGNKCSRVSHSIHLEITLVYVCRLRMCLYVEISLNNIHMSTKFYPLGFCRLIFYPTYICRIIFKRHIWLNDIYPYTTYIIKQHILLNDIYC